MADTITVTRIPPMLGWLYRARQEGKSSLSIWVCGGMGQALVLERLGYARLESPDGDSATMVSLTAFGVEVAETPAATDINLDSKADT